MTQQSAKVPLQDRARFGRAFLRFAILILLLAGQAPLANPTVLAMPAAALTNHMDLVVLDASNSSPIPEYKYLINVDNTGDPLQARNDGCSPENPGYPDSCDWPSIRAVPGAAPIFTQGNQDDFNGNTLSGLVLPDGKYLISVMANGYKIGGVHFTMPMDDANSVTVSLQPHPLPTATMRIKVFEDNASVNGQMDTDEHGLAGFHVVINDILGQVSTDVFGNPLCTTYDTNGDPTGLNLDGCLISDANGDLAIPNLGPNRFDVSVVPPTGTDWTETTTLEGSPSWDTWLAEGSNGLDNEFVVAGEPFPWTIFGFIRPTDNLNSGATGGISGTLISASVYLPQQGALPYFGDIWSGFNGTKVNGPITDGWVALSDLQSGDQAVYVAKANPDGTFAINNVPDGNYLFTWWDTNLNYILDWIQVTVSNGQMTDIGTPMLTGWFTKVDGYVFNDINSNGKHDPGEPGIPDYLVVLKDRENSEIDRMSISATTDANGYYVFEKAYPMGSWMILEAYTDRYYTTGITYQVENQPEETTVLGAGVDVGVLPILGQGGRLDWGVHPYAPGTNGGIVGTVFYDTTRNELDPRYQAVEGWAPGIPGVLVTLSRPIDCGTTTAPCDPTEMYELAPDGSIAKDMTAGGVACGTTGAPC
ncbi:MAG TPA: SdrD B-like domain-containing protein, partial [Anaerolineales bacterium]|nr:SdrD B-like domain-containing protein [Anaerolineales bacterium]